jgi:N-acetylglucosamine kinase-like BadF-type ATPase
LPELAPPSMADAVRGWKRPVVGASCSATWVEDTTLPWQGLRAVLSQYDLNGRITPLAETILRTLALNRLQDLVNWAMQAEKMDVARLAPCIFEAAKIGDPEMRNIVENAANILAEFTAPWRSGLIFRTLQSALSVDCSSTIPSTSPSTITD